MPFSWLYLKYALSSKIHAASLRFERFDTRHGSIESMNSNIHEPYSVFKRYSVDKKCKSEFWGVLPPDSKLLSTNIPPSRYPPFTSLFFVVLDKRRRKKNTQKHLNNVYIRATVLTFVTFWMVSSQKCAFRKDRQDIKVDWNNVRRKGNSACFGENFNWKLVLILSNISKT